MTQKENSLAILRSIDTILNMSKLILLIICILIIQEKLQNNEKLPPVEKDVFWCGVSDYPSGKIYEEGKILFISNCAQCHAKDMRTNLTGPALINAIEEWNSFPRKDLYEWIRHSQKLIKKGHPRARELWRQYRPTIMNDFPNLSDADIEAIFKYVKAQARSSH